MITDKARELSKLAKDTPHENALENLPERIRAQEELMEELHANCHPTLEEFLELARDMLYKPEKYWEAVFGSGIDHRHLFRSESVIDSSRRKPTDQ